MKKFAWLILVIIVITSMFMPLSKVVAAHSIEQSLEEDTVDDGPILPPEFR